MSHDRFLRNPFQFTITGTDSFVKSKPPTLVANVTHHLVFLTFFMKTVRSGKNHKNATAQCKESTEKTLLKSY